MSDLWHRRGQCAVHVVNDRHIARRAMVLTTNNPLEASGVVLHDPDLAAAIIDQVLGHGQLARAVARLEGGAPLGLEALVRAGWLGQRVLSSAARNRVHVALSTLRGLGLDGLIERVDGGYRFVLAVPVVRRARLE